MWNDIQKRYNNYHKHTMYSNLRTIDVVTKPEEYMQRAVELGHTTYFTGEHGFQGNLHEAQTLCEKYNLKPIYSVEAYYVNDISDKTDRKYYHIMLVGMTEKARYEINKIISIANTDGFYYKPRIGLKELLSLTPTDTVVTTACVASKLSDFLIYERDESGKRHFVEYASPEIQEKCLEEFLYPVWNHFGKNFYLEVQSHKTEDQIVYNKMILALNKKFKIPLIHANDSHYIYEGDSYYRDLFLKAKDFVYEEESNFILDYPDYDTIVDRYCKQGVLSMEQIKEALDNTLIFDDAEPVYTDKEFKIPKVPNKFIREELHSDRFTNENSNEVLDEIINRAWSRKKKLVKARKIPEYEKSIKYETEIVHKCNMADYFILDHMVVDRAVNKYGAVLTRSGRGSAVSFLINNLLGLTEVDRIKAPIKLYPTRFMSAERILSSRSLPDIDLNFADVEPVIRATKDILGEDGIYYMVAYKPLQRSSAFRLWCKARGYQVAEYDEVAKLLAEKNNTDEDIISNHPEWKVEIEYSKRFRGVIESVSPSPCSFLLSNDAISEKIGLIKVGDIMCCCLDGYNCDVYKYLKNDYLTVSVYKIISEVYKLIGKPIDDISTLVNNCDDKVWNIYEKGLTTTVNQVDSDSGKQLIMRYKPKSLAELSAWVAAIRPGFASLLNNFLERKPYSTGVKELDDILKDSFSYLLYQESIMSYLVFLGIEEKETYDIIKKIAKKKFKAEELEELKEKLLRGWIKNVGKREGFEETWQVVEDASRYSFNASHAVSVSIDSLYTAYLKAYYPLEYFTVVLTLYADDSDRTAKLTSELEHFGIKVRPIKFGKSKADYFMDRESNIIYKGIKSIKYCNSNIADELYELSKNEYDNFIELLVDIYDASINSRQLDILIKLNFFEEFGGIEYLLECNRLFDEYYGKKQIKKQKAYEAGLDYDLLRKHCVKETQKTFSGLDSKGLLSELVETIPNDKTKVRTIVMYQMEHLGYIEIVDKKYAGFCVVTDINVDYSPKIKLYALANGNTIPVKIDKKIYARQPLKRGDIIKVEDQYRKNKMKKVEGKWVESDEKEWWIREYKIC